jgi:tryptophan synthase alpha subunit
LKESIRIVRAMADAGVALIELQIPFSDPMADGPTIMAANEAALETGVCVADCFRAAESLARVTSVPLLFMSYFNILFRYPGGVKSFCKSAAEAGVDGLIVPDIPPEETADAYWVEAPKQGVLPIPVVAPTSGLDRLKKVRAVAREGFVYCVSTTGTTGARRELPASLPSYLKKVRTTFKLPIALGFGISSRSQVEQLKGVADIAIVGSAMIDAINKGPANSRVSRAARFSKSLCK